MNYIVPFIKKNPLVFLLLALPLTLAAQLLGWPPVAVFVKSSSSGILAPVFVNTFVVDVSVVPTAASPGGPSCA